MKIGIYCYLIADFLQNFYRNVPCVVLYQTYLFSSLEPKDHRWAYSIGRHPSSVRPSSSSSSVRQHFQRTSQKPWSRFLPYFTYGIYRQAERKILFFFCPIRLRTLVAMATYSCHWLIMVKNENWRLLRRNRQYFDKSFSEMFLEWSSTNHMHFVQISDFDWLPWQPKS